MNLRNTRVVRCILAILVLGIGSTQAGIPVEGILGMTEVESASGIAVWVPHEDGQAIVGIRWFNNDGTVIFPRLLVTGGHIVDPADLQDAIEVSTQLSGDSSEWSEVQFDYPVAGADGGIYVVFVLPQGSAYIAEGAGGGAGIGYTETSGGLRAWFTLVLEEWIQLYEGYSIAVEPIVEQAGDDVVIIERSAAKAALVLDDDTPEVPLVTALMSPSPNPFNPQTKIRFTLSQACKVNVSIYDLRGHLIRTLASGQYSAGLHELVWLGKDDSGRNVSSGVYSVRLVAPELSATSQMTLVR